MRHLALSISALLFAAFCGCPAGSNRPVEQAGENREHAHGAHDHSHAAGPSGGHVLVLGDEEYHVEWLHDDDEGLLTFIILDSAMKNEVPIEAKELVVELTLENNAGEKQTQEISIPAESSVDGKSARFALADKAALFNITENKKVDAVLKVAINGKDYTAKIEHDSHHGHSHSHD